MCCVCDSYWHLPQLVRTYRANFLYNAKEAKVLPRVQRTTCWTCNNLQDLALRENALPGGPHLSITRFARRKRRILPKTN